MTSLNIVRDNDLAELVPTTKILQTAVVNADATLNTLANIDQLAFAVMAGRIYEFEYLFYYTAAATSTGSRWTINGPATPTALGYESEYTLTATTNTVNNAVAYQIPAASNATSLAGVNTAVIRGYIIPSANGVVTPQFASEIANSAITCLKGSRLTYREMAA